MKIVYNKDKSELCRLLINDIIDKSKENQINIAVSGGRTPKLLFSLMSEDFYLDKINWHNIKMYWVDERCVPPSDDQSNYKMTYGQLLSKVNIPEENVFRIKGESEPMVECKRYNTLVLENLPCKEGFPVFDISIMGIGDDGHTSSIFFDQMELLDSNKPYDLGINPYNGQKRIAMTGKTILNSKYLVFLVMGENKASVIKNILEDNQEANGYPSYHIVKKRKDSVLFTDVNIF